MNLLIEFASSLFSLNPESVDIVASTSQTLRQSIPELIEENGVKVGTFSIPHHGSEEMTTMWDFQKNSDHLCDACLISISDETKVMAHRLVLSAASKYFRNIFKNNTEGVKFVLPLKDVSGTVLLQIVEFVYTGKIKLTEEDVEEYLMWSNFYQLPKLTSLCEKFLILNLDMSNLMRYKEIASTYGCDALKQEVLKRIDEYFMDFHQSSMLQETNADELMEILLRNSLRCDSEENVFNAVVNWLEFNPGERKQHLMQLVPCIRFPLLSPRFILRRTDVFKESKEALQHCFKAMQFHDMSQGEKESNKEFCAIPRVFTQNTACIPINVHGQTTELKSLAYYQKGFFTYVLNDRSWNKIYSLNISSDYFISSKDDNQVLFTSSQSKDYVLIDFTLPSLKETQIAGPICNGEKLSQPATCIVGSEIYFIGGRSNSSVTNCVFVFNLITNKMRSIRPMQFPRLSSSAILFNNCIYVVGWNKTMRDVEKFDVRTEEWSSMAPLLYARYESKCIVYEEMLYVFGGFSNVVERYDFAKNKWTVVFSSLPCNDVDNALVVDGAFFVTVGDRSYRYDNNRNKWVEMVPLPNS